MEFRHAIATFIVALVAVAFVATVDQAMLAGLYHASVLHFGGRLP